MSLEPFRVRLRRPIAGDSSRLVGYVRDRGWVSLSDLCRVGFSSSLFLTSSGHTRDLCGFERCDDLVRTLIEEV